MDPNATFYAMLTIWIATGVGLAWSVMTTDNHPRDPFRALRRAGLTTVGIGTVTVLLAPFVPFGIYTRASSRTGEATSHLESLWSLGIEPVQVIWLAVVWAMSLIIGLSVVIHQSGYAQAARWKAVIVLIILTVLGSFSIGWMFIPVTMLAFVTAIHGRHAFLDDSTEVSDSDRAMYRG